MAGDRSALPHLTQITGRELNLRGWLTRPRPPAAQPLQHGAAINDEIASADYLIAGGFGAMLLDPVYAFAVSSEFDLR
jgi:hypothetical protein